MHWKLSIFIGAFGENGIANPHPFVVSFIYLFIFKNKSTDGSSAFLLWAIFGRQICASVTFKIWKWLILKHYKHNPIAFYMYIYHDVVLHDESYLRWILFVKSVSLHIWCGNVTEVVYCRCNVFLTNTLFNVILIIHFCKLAKKFIRFGNKIESNKYLRFFLISNKTNLSCRMSKKM